MALGSCSSSHHPPGEPVGCALGKLSGVTCDSRSFTTGDPVTAELTHTVKTAAAGLPRVTLVSIDDIVCPDRSHCPAAIDGTIVRYDQIHYWKGFAYKLVPELLTRAEQSGLSFSHRR